MHDELVIQKAVEEIVTREFGTTEQILTIHEVIYENGKPKVLRVNVDYDKNEAVVYFQIKDEKFYLAVYLDTKPDIAVRWVGMQAYHSVYFSASSDEMSYEQLCRLTTLVPTDGWNKGDMKKSGNVAYRVSKLMFEPDLGPNAFETKISRLLDLLETDKQGIAQLANLANGYIQVATVFHNGNTMLGGHHLDKSTISRLAKLNLEIDFDEYAEGNSFM
ncbi:MAG: DUF4279 domain-containing protein [Bacteroidetes bacterium]|nr:DUF4279 domain-containing protein [Bacteroidota bacterium]